VRENDRDFHQISRKNITKIAKIAKMRIFLRIGRQGKSLQLALFQYYKRLLVGLAWQLP
jgi:hypothetical protein